MKSAVKFVAAIAAGALLSGNALSQGIPVIDAANLMNSVQQVLAWGQQFEQMKNQISQQQQMYNAMNGSRGLGSLLNNPALKNALPVEWQSVYTSLQYGGYAGLTGSAKAIRDASKIVSCDSMTGQSLKLCNQEMNKPAQDKAYAQDAYASAQARVSQIEGLTREINNTTDQKSIAELNARIAAEQAAIQNEQTKLQMFKMLAEADDRLIEQKKYEMSRERGSRRQTVAEKLVPLQY
jgi:type IV secretion system protein VirB5